MEITTIGLDFAKRVFQAHEVNEAGRAVLRRRLGRAEVLDFFRALPPCLVGIEACGTAHQWARLVAPERSGRSGCQDGTDELPWGPISQGPMGMDLVVVVEPVGQ